MLRLCARADARPGGPLPSRAPGHVRAGLAAHADAHRRGRRLQAAGRD